MSFFSCLYYRWWTRRDSLEKPASLFSCCFFFFFTLSSSWRGEFQHTHTAREWPHFSASPALRVSTPSFVPLLYASLVSSRTLAARPSLGWQRRLLPPLGRAELTSSSGGSSSASRQSVPLYSTKSLPLFLRWHSDARPHPRARSTCIGGGYRSTLPLVVVALLHPVLCS